MTDIDKLLCLGLIKEGKGDYLKIDQIKDLHKLGYSLIINDGKILDAVKEEAE